MIPPTPPVGHGSTRSSEPVDVVRTPPPAADLSSSTSSDVPDRSTGRSPVDASLDGLASQLGMTVVELISAMDSGRSLSELFTERGIAPAPGSIADIRI